MKKLVLGLMAMIGVAGLFVAKSTTYAGETKRAQTVESWTQEGDEAAWDAWREDFQAALELDEQYQAADLAVKTDEGDNEEESAMLEALRDDNYGEIAKIVYQKHFGAWEGTDEEFDELLNAADTDPIVKCATQALKVCGAGKVCSFKIGPHGCEVVCQTGNDPCPGVTPRPVNP